MVSIVIPAHDEAAVIGDCLDALFRDADPSEFEVVIVCNGCSDDTAARARAFGDRVTVIEMKAASKTEALNRGDRAVSSFPRLYLDADVVLDTTGVRAISQALASGPLAASPALRLDLSRSRTIVRSYYRIWKELPQITGGLVGRGRTR